VKSLPQIRGDPLLKVVGDLKLQEVIIHKKVQEGPSTPLQNPQEEFKTHEEKSSPPAKDRKIIIKLKTHK